MNVPYKTGDVFSLYPIGDVHLGSVNCDKDLFDATIKHGLVRGFIWRLRCLAISRDWSISGNKVA